MKNRGIYVLIMLIISALLPQKGISAERELFDFGWKFTLENPTDAYLEDYDDSGWRSLDLPHDWSVEGKVDRNNAMGNDGGYYPDGIGWYRKTFTLPASFEGKKLRLFFEGVYERSEVYVNGVKVGGHPYGYMSFYCDITDAVEFGGKNVLAVKADNSHQKNCRWYSGSGIYRHVWLLSSDFVHIADQGVFITTPTADEVVSSVTLVNETDRDRNLVLRIRIPEIGEIDKKFSLSARSQGKEISLTLPVENPKLWSPETPNLYNAEITLEEADGAIIDSHLQTFGIRTFEYSADKGFILNGIPVELNGACAHHDNGILGARGYDRADEWRVELLKKAGFNAVRTSHNLSTEAFLDACDRIGLLVIDESFDNWRDSKNTHDYSEFFDEWWKHDVQAMVLRDRNHPSIFCWSIGNEVIERKKIEVVTTARKLVAAIHEYDTTRPVTSALAAWDSDWEIYDPLAEAHDIVGYNYMIHKSESDHQRVPSRIMMQTESYPRDAFSNWEKVVDNSYIIGDFVWTGLDYLGEAGIGRYWYETDTPGEHYQRPLFPWHGAYCGDIDVTGWRKPISHYRDMLHNGTEKLYMAVREPDHYFGKGKITAGQWAVWPTWESWNWPGHEGKDIEVEVISRYDSVRLYLNGELIGEKPTDRGHEFKAVFKLPYAAGTLVTEGIEDGNVVEKRSLSTSGKPYAIRATADRSAIAADGQDLSFITIEIVDKEGQIVPNADNLLSLALKGKAEIIGAGSADMQDLEPYSTLTPRIWKGRALVVLKSLRVAGSAQLKITSDGLRPATVRITTAK